MIDFPALAEAAYRRLKDVESRSPRPPRHRQKLFLALDKISFDHKTGRLDRVADGLAFLAAAARVYAESLPEGKAVVRRQEGES